MPRGRKKAVPTWVPEGYTLGHDPNGYQPHVHEREPLPGTPEGARIVCQVCKSVLVAKITQQGFVWVLTGRRLTGT